MKMKNKGMQNSYSIKSIWYIAFFVALIVMMIFAKYVLQMVNEDISGIWLWIKKSNINFYFILLSTFGVTFLVLRFFMLKLFPKGISSLRIYNNSAFFENLIVLLVVLSIGLCFLQWLFINQKLEFAYNYATIPIFKVSISTVIFIVTLGVVLTIYAFLEKKDISKYFVLFVYMICTLFTFWGLFIPNFFRDDVYHGLAVVEQIYNIYDHVPFTYTTTGIYGHYGLFFLPIMKLFGNDLYVIVGVLAVVGVIAFISVLYVIHNLMPCNWLRILTACALVMNDAVLRTDNHWQTQPLRVVFPGLLMAYAVYTSVHSVESRKRRMGGGWLIGVLATLWNTEVGIFCLVAYSVYEIAFTWQKNSVLSKNSLIGYVLAVVFVLSGVLTSVAIVNIYNLAYGGSLIFRTFFFPLLEKSYMDGTLRYDMLWGNHAWLYVLVLFLLVLCYGVFHTSLFKNKDSCDSSCKMAPVAILIACLGLFNLTYYVNRAAYTNLMICYPMAICANSFLISNFWPVWQRKMDYTSFNIIFKKSISIICMSVILACSLHILYAPVVFNQRQEKGWYQLQSLKNETMQIAEIIPAETYGIGGGVSILYHILGWENYGHFRDVPDLRVGGNAALEAMIQETLQHDSFLCNIDRFSGGLIDEILKKAPEYHLETIVTVQDLQFGYYTK